MAAAEERQPGARSTGSAVPVIDVADYLAGARGAREAVGGEIRFALENVGFFVLVNHDVPRDLVARAFGEARRIHALDAGTKMSLRMNEHNNGYMAMARYTVRTAEVNAGAAPDLNEAFFVKRERPPAIPCGGAARRFVGPNVWPDGLPGFRGERARLHGRDGPVRAPHAAGGRGRPRPPRGLVRQGVRGEPVLVRLSHYPPVAAGENQFGIAPPHRRELHDLSPAVGGAGARGPDAGRGMAAVPDLPDSFAVNSGDTLHRWTNGRFKSTAHRARPPVGRHRYAIPFFFGPHVDTLIECLPTCRAPGSEPRFAPITYGDYLEWWYTENYPPERQDDA